MAPNKWTTEPSAEWLAAHGHRLLMRRAEDDGGNFAVRSGNKLKEWVQSRDPTGLFVATIIVCLVVFVSVCALLWETLRKIRKRASGKGWRQLQNDKEERAAFRNSNGGQGMPLGRFYEPRQGQLYDPPRAGAGGQVMMRQGGIAPPPIPPMPRQYQQGYQQQQQQQQRPTRGQSNFAAVAPSGQPPQQPAGTPSAPKLDLQDVVYQSSPTSTRESSQMSQSTNLGADSPPNSNRNSFASNDTEPLILPAPPSAPSPAPIPSPPAAAPTPVREKSFTGSVTSEKAPTIELKRTWTLKSWLPGDKKEEGKAEEKGEGIL